jgi:hypothetical protein
MNRVWDYAGFAVWFVGLGYIAVWFVPDHGSLSPALHVVGLTAAGLVAVRLMVLAIARLRRPAAGVAPVAARKPHAMVKPRAEPPRPLPTVKPRRHFGLRGAPD